MVTLLRDNEPRRPKRSSHAPEDVFVADASWPSGFREGRIVFRYSVRREIIRAITRTVLPHLPEDASLGMQLSALLSRTGPAGFYHLKGKNGEWFVRVSGRRGDPLLETSMVDYLLAEGVSVCPILQAGLCLEWEGQTFRVDIRPFIHGRHFNDSLVDIASTAGLLAKLHAALRRFPGWKMVRNAARIRYCRFDEIRRKIAVALKKGDYRVFVERADWAQSRRQWLRETVSRFDPRMDRRAGAQCVHGDLFWGNVLYRIPGGQPVFCDFEESAHHYAPPSWDLAYFIQRFCLKDNPSPLVFRRRLKAVRNAYGSIPASIGTAMRQNAAFAILYLAEGRLCHNFLDDVGEYEKFVGLEQQSRYYRFNG